MSLTDLRRALLAYLRERIAADGMPPSQQEIAAHFGFRQNRSAGYHLQALQAQGLIELLPGRARGIRLIKPEQIRSADRDDARLELPILGRVAAGPPIGSDAEAETHVLIDRLLFSPRPDYLLRVKGDSMREDGIFDGDLVAVHRTRDARNGQTVVARIADEITIKRLRIDADGIALLPRNPDYAPILIAADADFAIEGIYCGLVRRG
ncbi:transcriptional repressor LexA [Lysobacter capsici]|uniref:transcriptional repressor LexA n=1 Tax=Lysobacter capsici TaxID=435897 RepID=UPI00287B8C77|nr:transcriptional repressor LexA [Lysobacter capsici]WND82828.1 transcriptional repressor LexA [Lysobacter capsici]WND88026.1 transcriptional repressor LexA [Lysobacter capsici]